MSQEETFAVDIKTFARVLGTLTTATASVFETAGIISRVDYGKMLAGVHDDNPVVEGIVQGMASALMNIGQANFSVIPGGKKSDD